MSDYHEDIHTEYPTYNGMNRPAMILGAPLMPMVFCTLTVIFLAMIANLFIGVKAFFLVGLVLPIYFGLKTISENDDQAMKIYALEAKWLLRRILSGAGLRTFTLHAGKYGRHRDDYENYQRLLEQNTQSNGKLRRLHAKNLPTRYQ